MGSTTWFSLVLAVAAIAVATAGAGRLSLDHLFFSGTDFSSWLSRWGGLLVAVALVSPAASGSSRSSIDRLPTLESAAGRCGLAADLSRRRPAQYEVDP